jgi:general secretion pathway protein D
MERLKKNLSFNAVALLLVSMLLISSFVFFASNVSYAQDQTTLYVDPTPVTVEVCNPFTVNVDIADVSDLIAWQFNMTFDPTLIDFLSVVEGPFLRSVGTTLFGSYNGTNWVLAWCALMVFPPGASGSGILAYVNFHCKGPGNCPLHFEPYPQTVLFNSLGESIPFTANDGIVSQYQPQPWYIKPPYPDYAPSGMPDFDERQNNWYWRAWAYPDAVAVWQHYDQYYNDWDIYYSIYTDPNIWWTIGTDYARPIVSDSPIKMSFLPGDDKQPAISWYSSNYAIAVWQHWMGSEWDIWYSVFTPNVGWSIPGPVATNMGYNDYDPAIAFDTTGYAVCVWVHGNQPANTNIYYSVWNPGLMSWVGPNALLNAGNPGPGKAAMPEIDVDSNHKAVTIWTDTAGAAGTERVYFSWAAFNPPAVPAWTAPAVVPGCVFGMNWQKGISPDTLGHNLMDWGLPAPLAGQEQLYYAIFSPGMGWIPATTPIAQPTNGEHPDLAYDFYNNAIAVYSQFPTGQIYYSFWNGVNWQPVGGKFAATSGFGPDQWPAVAFIKNNKAVLVWNAYPEPYTPAVNRSEIYYSVYTPTYPADSWTQAKKIYEPNNPGLFLMGDDYYVDIASPTGSATTPMSTPPEPELPWTVEPYWTWCGPLAVANSIWWFDSEYEPNAVPPPTISDGFPLVKSYNLSVWDDHDPRNVKPFVEHLAYLMDTDGMRTKLCHDGTTVWDMQAGITHYLSWSGVNPLGDVNGDGKVDAKDLVLVNNAMGSKPGMANWKLAADIYPETVTGPYTADNVIDQNDYDLVMQNFGKQGMFYENTTDLYPSFSYIEEEVEKCEDVVLCLGFYQNGIRDGGHFVTVAGVNSTTLQLLISNPIRDDYEAGITPGRSPVPHVHMPPEPPYVTHNNASLVSQDAWNVVFNPSGGYWILDHYFTDPSMEVRIEYAVITSPTGFVHDIAVTNVTPLKTVVCQEYNCRINVTVTNEGSFPETFDLTLYAETMPPGTPIGTVTVSNLLNGTTRTITFTWNTAGFAKGNYTLWAYAWPVLGETHMADNTLTDSWIIVSMVGDITGPDGWPDGKCDMLYDIRSVAKLFGVSYPDPKYVANYDINDDGQIDMLNDIRTVAKHFGDIDPP